MEHAGVLALRRGSRKYIEPGKGPQKSAQTNTETGLAPGGQMYELNQDIGETNDLAAAQANQVKEDAARLEQIRQAKRSRP